MIKLVATGLLAGLVAGVLYVAAGNGSLLSLLLFYTAPLPLAIAGFVWYWPASIASIISGAIVVAFSADLRLAAVFTVSFTLPIAWFCHRILLFRETAGADGTQDRAWYPLGNVVASVGVMAALLVIVGILTISSNLEDYQIFVQSHFQSFSELSELQGDGPQLDAGMYENFLNYLSLLLPIVLAAGWIMIILINLYGGAKIASLSGQLTRPWDDLSAISLPQGYGIAMVPAILGTMLPGLIGLASLILLGTLAIAHAVIGLSILHSITRKFPGRPILLAIVYGGVMLLGFPLIILSVLGIVEPWARFRDRAGGGGSQSGPGTT